MQQKVSWVPSMKTAKAVVAAATELLGTIGVAISDGEVTAVEAGVIFAALLAAYGLVFKTSNEPV